MPSPLFDDTIAAIATAQGRSAVAVLRVSGPDAGGILLRVCPGLADRLPAPRQQRLVTVRHPGSGEVLDRALASWFPGPGSYTGEDTFEISTHGGVLTPQLVLDALLAAGARSAERGEFTRRAVFHGKLDLLQAEAVLDLIDGRAPAFHRAAIHQMDRGLSRRIDELRNAVLQVEALVTYGIDFPEEDEPPVAPERVREAALAAAGRIDALLATAPQGEMLREGALVVLAGRPNSGKSSLFNALLGAERAIVTEVPGTTRDALEAVVTLEGYPFRLVDTAGLRETGDRVEAIGIEVARRYLRAAQIVLFCAEHGRPLEEDERTFLAELESERTILLRTKADRRGTEGDGGRAASLPSPAVPEVVVSALDGQGLADLRGAMLELAFGGILGEPGEAPLVTRERHARALRLARDELDLFLEAAGTGVPMEFAATHLRAAAGTLEDLIGVVTPDDILGQVFGQFCVGK